MLRRACRAAIVHLPTPGAATPAGGLRAPCGSPLASADVVYGSRKFDLLRRGAADETATVLILRNELRTHRRNGEHDGRPHQCGPCPGGGRQPACGEPGSA